jgi:hypothetical protein
VPAIPGNGDLVGRVLVRNEHTGPAPARSTLFHQSLVTPEKPRGGV